MSSLSIKILWVEDNIGDILLIKEAFEHAGFIHHLNVVDNGVDALDFLFRRGRYARASRPDLIILDINLPKKSGREIISEIKTDSTLSQIPLVVLTSSKQDKDVLDGFDPKRSLYLIKPLGFPALIDVAKQIHNFWQSLASPEQKP